MTYKDKIQILANLIKGSDSTFALTGAGISTESGIPDFRSPGTGLWEKTDPMKAASVSTLLFDPAGFYKINLKWWAGLSSAQPNAAHYALARLEKEGLLEGVITQNIDGLHRKAGSEKVWEVHGNLRTCRCLNCSESYPFEFLVNQFDSGINPPRCEVCEAILRPDVVLFEDPLGDDFYHAERAVSKCHLLIVVGSSLQVYPVASLPEWVKQVVIINNEPTPWDINAEIVINEKAGKVFTDTLSALNIDI